MTIDLNAYLGHFAFRRLPHATGTELVRLMDKKKIDKAAVSSASAITYRNAQAGNEEVAEQARPHGDRLIPFAVINPAYAGWLDDLKECHERYGMRGVRLYPMWHGYRLTDGVCRELVAAATERRMVISIPVRVEDSRQRSWLVDIPNTPFEDIAGIVRAMPEARFVLVNGSGYAGSILGRANNGLPANYVIDVALLTAVIQNEIGQLLASLGPDRVVFGTGMPFLYPDPAMVKLEVLDAPETTKAKIRGLTAAKLLGIAVK